MQILFAQIKNVKNKIHLYAMLVNVNADNGTKIA